MCGVTGLLLSDGIIKKGTLSNMVNCLNHRGPDNSGTWLNDDKSFGLGHTRLSILDLSSAGSQPMHSNDNRYVMSYNGEIYNHLSLRLELKKDFPEITFKSNSDTETILSCIEKWGIKKSLQKTTGMFAIALWDKKNEELKLARDRFGEKPMYYGWIKNSFYFGSELKPIKNNPYFDLEIDRCALSQFIKYSYIPQPKTIYKDIKKLKPGTILTINSEKKIIHDEFWSLNYLVKSSLHNKQNFNENDTINHLEHKIQESVEKQKLSDVSLGAFLSGGIDSSLIVSMMQLNSDVSINSFTIGFNQKLYNEANYASKVAKHIKTNHTELYVSDSDVRNVIPLIPQIYDEPFADSSQLPTYLVSKLASTKVKVALSGDGGDELFGGYNRYFQAPKWYKMPMLIKFFGSKFLNFFSPRDLNIIYNAFKHYIPSTLKSSNPVNHLTKIADIFKSNSEWEVYDRLVSSYHSCDQIVINNVNKSSVIKNFPKNIQNLEYELKMMYSDMSTYLTDDILCKVDRAAMSVSLETRTPFLDHQLVEFAWNLPLNFKIRNGEGKWILKKILNKYIPNKLINRPKMGFGIPLETWLRGPLREWAELLLNKKSITEDGFFNYDIVKDLWDDHISGKKNNQYILWNILVFQSWKSKWL